MPRPTGYVHLVRHVAQAVLGKIIAGKAVSATDERPSVPANVALIDPWPYASTTPVRSHDVLADGSFVAIGAVDAAADGASTLIRDAWRRLNRVSEFHDVLNFFEEPKERVGN